MQYSVTAGYLGIRIEKSEILGLNQEISSQPRLLIKQMSLNVIRVPPWKIISCNVIVQSARFTSV